jgi:hypothetical protein
MHLSSRLTVTLVALPLALGFSGSLRGAQNPFEKQLGRVDWQPTWTIPGARYVGKEACAQCHADIAAAQAMSAMAHALSYPSDSLVQKLHVRLAFTNGPYRYSVERKPDGVFYAVTDGTNTVSLPVSWAFGLGIGEVGQTYLLSYNGSYYEGRVSFFNSVQGLDVTLGHSARVPASLQEALGRMVQPEEARACFGCHSTGAVSDGRLQLNKLSPGITCEGCHGPGAEHVATVQSGKLKPPHIFNPATLPPGDLVKFCGACHRTRAHVEAQQLKGTLTVRFQPYRLMESRCFNPRDRRISCLACHNPHQDPEHEPAFYDSKCLACHARSGTGTKPERLAQHRPPACPVASSRCITCHMPKYEPLGSHFKFTDHRIRVVRLGDTFD